MTAQDTQSRISTEPTGGWEIEVLYAPHGQQLGLRRTLVSGHLTISRRGSADPGALELADAAVSRDAVRLEATPNALQVLESGARNPVMVDGLQIDGNGMLQPGSLVRVGNTILGVSASLIVRPLDEHGPDASPLPPLAGVVRALRLGPSEASQHLLYDVAHLEDEHRVLLVEGDPGDALLFTQWLAAHRGLSPALEMPELHAAPSSLLGADQAVFIDLGRQPTSRERTLLAALVRHGGRERPGLVVCALSSASGPAARAGTSLHRYLHSLCDTALGLTPLPQRRLDIAYQLGRVLAQRQTGHAESATFIEAAVRHPWSGGVGELNHVIERLERVVQQNEPLEGRAWPFLPRRTDTPRSEHVTAAFFIATFARADGNMSEVARVFGVTRSLAYRIANRLGLDLKVLRGQIPARPGNRSRRVRSTP